MKHALAWLLTWGVAFVVGVLIIWALTGGSHAASGRHRELLPAISPEQARALLSWQGTNIGTCRQLGTLGVFCISDMNLSAEGRWIVIKILPTRAK